MWVLCNWQNIQYIEQMGGRGDDEEAEGCKIHMSNMEDWAKYHSENVYFQNFSNSLKTTRLPDDSPL